MNLFGIAMRITTATFLFVISAFSASIQQPAAAVVVCTGPGVPGIGTASDWPGRWRGRWPLSTRWRPSRWWRQSRLARRPSLVCN